MDICDICLLEVVDQCLHFFKKFAPSKVHVFSSSYGLYVSYNVHTISKKAVAVKGHCGIEDPQKLPICCSLRCKHNIVVLNDSSSSGESCDGKHSGSPLGLEFAVGEKW